MRTPEELEEEQQHFFRQHRVALILGAVVFVAIIAFVIKMSSGGKSAPRRAPELTMVNILPPPPPPPTPPPLQPPPEQEIKEEEQMIPEEQPQEDVPEPPDEPPIGTALKGDGPADGFGLRGSGSEGFGSGRAGGSKYGAYAGQVQLRIAEALRNNSRTRNAQLSLQVRIWPDTTGRIIRAQLASSTGDPSLDAAITNDVLTGLQLREPPPPDMPKPINLRLSARRP